MKIYKMKCESCGAEKLEKVGGFYVCKYCGSRIKIEEEAKHANVDVNPPIEVSDNVNSTKTNPSYSNNNKDTKNYSDKKSKFLRENILPIMLKILLCGWFGYLGVHKFIERKFFIGIVYLLTGGLFIIGYVFDLVRYIINLFKLVVDYKNENY